MAVLFRVKSRRRGAQPALADPVHRMLPALYRRHYVARRELVLRCEDKTAQ